MSVRKFARCALVCALSLGAGVVATGLFPGGGGATAADERQQRSMDIIETAVGPGMTQVTTVVSAIKAADLVEALKAKGPFTVFAPTNAAFSKLPAGTVDAWLRPENKEKLRSVLLYHVHAGDAILAGDVRTMSLSTINGKPLNVKLGEDGSVWINDAKVVRSDVVCSNGVIHWIDGVLMP